MRYLDPTQIDCLNVWDTLISRPGAVYPRRELLYWHGSKGFQALQVDQWKLFMNGQAAGISGAPEGPSLYKLASDPGELKDLSKEHPEKIRMMQELAGKRLAEIEKNKIEFAEIKRQ